MSPSCSPDSLQPGFEIVAHQTRVYIEKGEQDLGEVLKKRWADDRTSRSSRRKIE